MIERSPCGDYVPIYDPLRELVEAIFPKVSDIINILNPADGSCMFHGILDQIQSIQELQDYASNHFELCWKIVSDGYKLFLETDKLDWPDIQCHHVLTMCSCGEEFIFSSL